MEKPAFLNEKIEACVAIPEISLAAIVGGASAFAACGFNFLAEIVGEWYAQLA